MSVKLLISTGIISILIFHLKFKTDKCGRGLIGWHFVEKPPCRQCVNVCKFSLVLQKHFELTKD